MSTVVGERIVFVSMILKNDINLSMIYVVLNAIIEHKMILLNLRFLTKFQMILKEKVKRLRNM